MSIHGALATRLSAQVSSISGRVYRMRLPQNPTYPALTIERVTGAFTHSLSHTATVANPRFQVTTWAQSHTQAQTTADEVRAALDGWDGTEDGTTVQHSLSESETDIWDSDLKVYGIAQDYFVMFNL